MVVDTTGELDQVETGELGFGSPIFVMVVDTTGELDQVETGELGFGSPIFVVTTICGC
jgi:hypothetical protein